MTKDYKIHSVTVITEDVQTEEIDSVKDFDQNNPKSRDWFDKHIWWAMRNGKSVTLIPTEFYNEE